MSKAIDKVVVDIVLISYNIEIIARFLYSYRRYKRFVLLAPSI